MICHEATGGTGGATAELAKLINGDGGWDGVIFFWGDTWRCNYGIYPPFGFRGGLPTNLLFVCFFGVSDICYTAPFWGSSRSHVCSKHLGGGCPEVETKHHEFNFSCGFIIITTRWWFQIFFMFTPIWGTFPIWRSYFSNGLVQPPTSQLCISLRRQLLTPQCQRLHLFWEAWELKTRRGIFYNFLLVVLMSCWYMLMSHFGICWWCWCDFQGGGFWYVWFSSALGLFIHWWFQPAATVLQVWLSDRSLGGINEVALSNTQHRTGLSWTSVNLGQPVGWSENDKMRVCSAQFLGGFGKPKRSGEVWSHLFVLEVLEGCYFSKKRSSSRGAP